MPEGAESGEPEVLDSRDPAFVAHVIYFAWARHGVPYSDLWNFHDLENFKRKWAELDALWSKSVAEHGLNPDPKQVEFLPLSLTAVHKGFADNPDGTLRVSWEMPEGGEDP